MKDKENLGQVLSNFDIDGDYIKGAPYGDGHINDTYQVWFRHEGKDTPYLLQRINHEIFLDPVGLMRNISSVIHHIGKKIKAQGGDVDRETLQLIPTHNGENYYVSPGGYYYRCYVFIENAKTFLLVENPKHMYHAGKAFGKFQQLLADFPASTLYETIPDFHNSVKRYETFEQAVSKDVMGRGHLVEEQIAFVRDRQEVLATLLALHEEGKAPLRVTHNDTKFNNVMIDNVSGEGICVIDLDTVMPGLSFYDFGDAIRSGTNTAKEDEEDLSLVSMDMLLFEQYTKGYLEAAGGALTDDEIANLPLSAIVLTLECGMRFLTDYLEGDHYFKTKFDDHNLVRAKNQFALVKDMENKFSKMEYIVEKCGYLYL